MGFIELKSTHGNAAIGGKERVLIFTEGTILAPSSILKHFNHASYIPIKNAVTKITLWYQQGTEVLYLTSCKKEKHVDQIKKLFLKYKFPGQRLYYRNKGQKYKDIVEAVMPDILIEDDCRSIGGRWQMCITYVKPEIKAGIKSIVVKEFKGIDDLPELIGELKTYVI
jgi:hypothetical protein